jgi:hypothetical protein
MGEFLRPTKNLKRARASVVIIGLVLSAACQHADSPGPLFSPEFSVLYECSESWPATECDRFFEAVEALQNMPPQDDPPVCLDVSDWLLDYMETGNLVFDSDVTLANANQQNGIITIGQVINDGLWEAIYALTHETDHIQTTQVHDCENWQSPSCNRPDDVDMTGLDCANHATGESRSFIY